MKKEILESYKGVRDFYPEDQFILDYLKDTMSRVCEKFGFEHYHASVLEHAELYRNKSSDEIVNEQTYIFKDRGGREVVLRPEMTPTVARMVAKRRRELGFPLRLYSIPNVFRYERPQKGRLREHWQLNADIFGADSDAYDLEILLLSYKILKEFGVEDKDFVIKINSRSVLNELFEKYNVPPLAQKSTLQILDKKAKISEQEFKEDLLKVLANETEEFLGALESVQDNEYFKNLVQKLNEHGVNNIEVDPYIVRGFDYYTGLVFEIYPTNSDNPKAIFGGGRYDNLMEALGEEQVRAIGFGLGDVRLKDFLEELGLLPEYRPATEIMIVIDSKEYDASLADKAIKDAEFLRNNDINTAINFSFKKLDKQIKNAMKLKIPFALVLSKSGEYTIKSLKDNQEFKIDIKEVPDFIFTSDI